MASDRCYKTEDAEQLSPIPHGTMSYAGSQTSSPQSLLRAEDFEDDRKSTFSQDSGVPRAECAIHALQLVAGNRVRHGRCAPEFLEEMAARGSHDSLQRSKTKKFKVMSGQEARLFFTSYLSEHNKSARSANDAKTPSPIAFAVTVWDGNVKCVDYYMTWRGFKKQSATKEIERKIDALDAEFRRVVKKIDEEYSRVASLRMHDNLSPIKPNFDDDTAVPHPPPKVTFSGSVNNEKGLSMFQKIPEPPSSATDSVMSLPLLNGVRNVPFSHRMPLRVANPDRLSILSVETLVASVEKPKLSKLSSIAENHSAINGHFNESNKAPSFKWSDNSYTVGRASNERKTGSLNDDLIEFLIVFLGDKPNVDTTSWHGLERQSSIRTPPSDRRSPWIGPLARSDSDSLDPSSESFGEVWNANLPMNAGLKNYYPTVPVIPGSQYMTLSQMGSPAPTESPYLPFSNAHLDSPYVSWRLPMPTPHSRPASQVFPGTPHSSPFIYPSTPF